MDGQMKALTRYEVGRLMGKMSRLRVSMLKDLMERVVALDVGEELYQHYLSALPPVNELRELANGISPEMDFTVHETINGYRFIRTR